MKINLFKRNNKNKDHSFLSAWELELLHYKEYYIGLTKVHKNNEDFGWIHSRPYYSIYINNNYEWVRKSSYYDGPLEYISLGFIKIAWMS